jgi:predicted ATP-dependent Lon-type protease
MIAIIQAWTYRGRFDMGTIRSSRCFRGVRDEFWTKLSIEFYKDAADAVFKVLHDK